MSTDSKDLAEPRECDGKVVILEEGFASTGARIVD
jgi:hypothetical protein